MSWNLPKHEIRTFERNTLAAVIMQLRFQPILKITEHPARFQDRVRSRFPGYEQAEVQTFEIGMGGAPRVVTGASHRFRAADNEPTVLSLLTGSLSLEYTAHKNRKVLLDDAKLAVDALREEYSPVAAVRLGLRYVNLVDPQRIGGDLGRKVEWADLLTKRLSLFPGGLVQLDEATHFACEVTAPLERGAMTVRYGLMPGHLLVPGPVFALQFNQIKNFRLDTDRYVDGGFAVDEVVSLLDDFSSDIFQVFSNVAGDALLEWMGQPVVG